MDKEKVLVMDYETKNHLELVTQSHSIECKGRKLMELLWIRCQSAMGSRLLKRWIEYAIN